jgi:hypothetical protein
MGRIRSIWVLLVILVAPGVVLAQDAAVIVRTFNNFQVPTAQLGRAHAHAAAILATAGIGVTWLDCWFGDAEPAHAPRRCQTPVGGDLVVRLHRTNNTDRPHQFVSLGFALVVREGTPFLATVYADRAERIARRAAVDPAIVLGRAIAHEIGHLLLNSNAHPGAGLMRAAWTQRELQHGTDAEWQFLAQEVQAIRASAASRQALDPSR